ncbi:MAG: hypothetical protein GY805_23390 [Chloroflexi bacterium]|nr:hypothetical protein [Chloroflexota bacterium]
MSRAVSPRDGRAAGRDDAERSLFAHPDPCRVVPPLPQLAAQKFCSILYANKSSVQEQP